MDRWGCSRGGRWHPAGLGGLRSSSHGASGHLAARPRPGHSPTPTTPPAACASASLRFYFRGTCLRLPGPFSKSDAFVSRGGVSPFPPRDGAPCVGADVEVMSG